MKKRKTFKRFLIIFGTFAVLFIHFYIPRFITEIKNPILETLSGKQLITTSPRFENNPLKGKRFHFKSFDKVELSAYMTYSSSDSVNGTILLLHGIRSNKETFIGLSKHLSELGYNTVALDSRAHGASKGKHCTFGVKEKKDVSALLTFLEKNENITNNIGIWGQSLGGAIALQAMGSDKRLQFGIIESTFTDFKTITNDYFRFTLGFNIAPLTNYLVYRAGKIADFDPEEAQPIRYCAKISQPILLVHGDQDDRINIQYGKDNFMAIPSTKKEFITVKGAGHLDVWAIGGAEYFNKTVQFITENTLSKAN